MKPAHKSSRREPTAKSSAVYRPALWICLTFLAYLSLSAVVPPPRVPDPAAVVPAKPQDQKD